MALPDPVQYVPVSHCMHDAEIDAPVHPIQGSIVHSIQGFIKFPSWRSHPTFKCYTTSQRINKGSLYNSCACAVLPGAS